MDRTKPTDFKVNVKVMLKYTYLTIITNYTTIILNSYTKFTESIVVIGLIVKQVYL